MEEISASSLAGELAAIVGEENVLTDGPELIPYTRGSIDSGSHRPLAVVFPGSVEEVSGIIRVARRLRVPVVPRGGGSSPTGAVVPVKGGIVLDMKRLHDIVVRVEDGLVEAGAGATLQEVDAECRRHGYFFPPDPSSVRVATVGGAISENSGGMRCARFGVVKDWVLKVEAVLSDGTVTRFGEETYKNRAGFNILGLLIGSEGTLCVFTRAWLKIMPLPERLRRFAIFFSTIDDAAECIMDIRRSGVNPFILEYADRHGIEVANSVRKTDFPAPDGGMLIVDMDCLQGSEQRARQKLMEVVVRHRPQLVMEAQTREEEEAILEVRRIAFTAPGRLYSGFIDGDIVVPLSRIREAMDGIERIREKYGVYIATCGHVGDGNLHPQIGADINNREEWERAREAAREIDRLAINLGGSITGEHGIGYLKQDMLVEQFRARSMEANLDIMRGLKRLFDPDNILNPGKFALD
ncbi:glycolate oxidase subunit GlcD [Thermogymnomonas acidicola]|uniref:Glycolate oxidase subunit GlcD n=1 Tax=Thermogymnomonas acidicola TaxID=399579 RepID=A0AA37BTN1_9ARCH|nr:FAD-linked oxidase C-terminal domain-containing protein [Thermogymnomonas acidicola]GGM77385.1 glycolate oxidase subunit GlcD [Thermogymnomonas acidicola]